MALLLVPGPCVWLALRFNVVDGSKWHTHHRCHRDQYCHFRWRRAYHRYWCNPREYPKSEALKWSKAHAVGSLPSCNVDWK
ncbi:hypothetical protein DFH29DRAFT_947455 [Suillus ampliporus]|nr:hypothetical protein DFH29DRAFT_947455 [Suillus ampliporus]